MKQKVVIYQRVLPHYRIPFFRTLHSILQEYEIELTIVAGFEKKGTVPKTVLIDEPWVKYSRNYYLPIFGIDLTIQTVFFKNFFDDSVVVLEQSNRLLVNYLFFMSKVLLRKRICLWGHGRNFQEKTKGSLREFFKRKYTQIASWWFCYTEEGKRIISDNGFPTEKITVVANSVDTKSLLEYYALFSDNDIRKLKKELNLATDNIAVYCGGMYREKRIDFLIESCMRLRKICPDFVVLFIGDGPDEHFVKDLCNRFDWAIYLGPLVGPEKVKYFRLAKCQLMPGLVGLGIIDSFALKVPLVTTSIDFHSPEIAYLNNGVNGLITPNNIDEYVNSIFKLLTDDDFYQHLVRGCEKSNETYSIERMASNYAMGLRSVVSL